MPPQSFYDSQVLSEGFGYLTTRDGTTLSVSIQLPGPADAGPYPTVVEYSGYDPSNPSSPQPSTLIAQNLGYATVGVNMRGTGCSGGSFMYFEELQSLDGYDVIEAVAAQPWVAHGKVGMIGVSYPGISQLFVARTRPPHLAAIAPLSVIADTYRSTLYPGGIFNDGFALDWARDRVASGRPYGQGWERGIVDAGGPNGEECAENQLLRLQNPDLEQLIAENPYYEREAGDAIAPITFAGLIDVPVFMAGAWQDEQTGGHFPSMWDRFAPSIDTRFTATNGTHVESLLSQINRWYEFLEFYVARRIPQMPALFRFLAPAVIESEIGVPGVVLEADRFTSYPSYDAALAAYRSEPPVRIVFENGGRRKKPGTPVGTFELSFSQWPPAETVPKTWWFQPDQRLGKSPPSVADGDGKATTSYVYDPTAKQRTNYTGSTTSIWKALPDWHWSPLPLGKALAFDSKTLTGEVVMAGTGSVDLWLRSSAADTDIEVTLTEIRPDGEERYVQSGWLRASHRELDATETTELRPWHTHLSEDASPLPSGELIPVRVELFPFAHVFRPGSRIRVTVEAPGGNRPFWTFDDLPADGVVVNEIGHSVGHASRVVLPVIPGVDAPGALPACPSLRGQPCRKAYGAATPIKVTALTATESDRAAKAGWRAVEVSWKAPPASRPGHTVARYTVTELPGGAVRSVAASETAVRFRSLSTGSHWFVVEAEYAEGGGSGRSTPSNSVVVERASPSTTTSTTTSTTASTTTSGPPVSGAGTTTSAPAVTTTSAGAATTVAGTTTSASSVQGGPGGLLPRTGSDAANLLAAAVALIGGSALLLVRSGRARRNGVG
ncbi:MAG: CocE/NonD family hydrolase [Acidimicrobiia bacterium]|nr:CocE/NonD family hydrolase [Acidimicrobiia bacterium]